MASAALVDRRNLMNHTFGMVRDGGTRAHQGWDLVAAPMTPCYAVADGKIILRGVIALAGMGLTVEGANVREGVR